MIHLSQCVIYDKHGKILLVHRCDPGLMEWEIPGGKIEPGESPADTAVRELKEELGVSVEIVKKIGSQSFIWDNREINCNWFEATIKSGKIKLLEPEKFDKFGYYSIEEINNMEYQAVSINVWNMLKKLAS